MLFCAGWLVRRLVHSPFGRSLVGIRENVVRMHAIGAPVMRRRLLVYTISAALAGIAGALLAQTTQFVGLGVLSFDRSGSVLIMLVLGGAGRLYGAFVGVPLYMIAQDRFAEIDPVYWDFWIGLLLVLIVVFARGGVLGLVDRLLLRRLTAAMSAAARWKPSGCRKRFGALVRRERDRFPPRAGARHALIGPNGAGKTSFVNLMTGALAPAPAASCWTAPTSPQLPQAARVKRGLARTFQINALFRGLSAWRTCRSRWPSARGSAGDLLRPAGRHRAVIEEAYALLETLGLAGDAVRPVKELPYGRQRLVEIAIALGLAPKVLLLDEPAAGVPSGETASDRRCRSRDCRAESPC